MLKRMGPSTGSIKYGGRHDSCLEDDISLFSYTYIFHLLKVCKA